MKRHLWVGLVLTLAVLGGCSKDSDDKKDKGKGKGQGIFAPQSTSLKVTDTSGKPVSGAQVLIGTEQGKPFADNLVTTAADGTFQAPAGWTAEQPVTISARGFVRVTYFGQKPRGASYQIRPAEGQGQFELTGVTTGFQIRDRDGLVDFSLVIPALQRSDFFSFDMNSVISPHKDEISIIGQKAELPSNVSLPKQRESYFLPITLEKPVYRTYFRTSGTKRVVALRGQFPLKQVVDEMRGNKDFVALINHFSIQGGSVQSAKLSGASTRLDIAVDKMTFTQARRVVAPDFRDTEVVMAAAIASQQGHMYPTDVKNLSPRQPQDLRIGSGDVFVVTVGKRKSEMQGGPGADRLSAAILPFTNNVQPSLLPLLDDPRMFSNTHIRIPALRTISGVRPTGTYASLVTVQVAADGKTETVTTIWEVFAPDWADEIKLPVWPRSSLPSGKMRWGVTLIGQSSRVSEEPPLGPGLLETATHATRSSVEF